MTEKKRQLVGPKGGTTTITPGGMVKTIFYLDPETREQLEGLARERRMSISAMGGELIALVLDSPDLLKRLDPE